MKISFGLKIKHEPWGGGNQFLSNIIDYFKDRNVKIINHLNDKDIDIIVLMDPRYNSSSSTFNHFDIEKYLKKINKNAIVVHRVNECDERKGTKYVNKNLIDANNFADHTVFISSWLKNILSKYKEFENSSIILNGANSKIFNYSNYDKILKNKIKIVTHHWSTHKNKGFEVYSYLDELLNDVECSNKIDFTFIGNLPKNFKFKNTRYIEPKNGSELADLIKTHDVYLTASINEPGGNHQNEGLNCGLPVLYLDSGCMSEYCKGYGLAYSKDTLKEKIFEIQSEYINFRENLKNYPYNSDFMCIKYEELFVNLMERRNEIVKNRKVKKTNFISKLIYKFNLN